MGSDSFSKKAVEFIGEIGRRPPVIPLWAAESGVEILNPYRNAEVREIFLKFVEKFYDDNFLRVAIIGINPGRLGAGLTGISFTDPFALREKLGIESSIAGKREISSEFIYRVASEIGGVKQFFGKVYLTAACPLGFTKQKLNYNFYDNADFAAALQPFIVKSLEKQLEFGLYRNKAIILGAGKLAEFMRRLNDEHKFFNELVILEHPRFIMQYRRKQTAEYIAKYCSTFCTISDEMNCTHGEKPFCGKLHQ
ncbi:SMUG2 DNA glycosylase family protein [Ignavibacteria bacterium]|nr:DUF4918 family protein [Bacteroidota bacterium]MCZ2133373.1 DUF4918 family protein [Bacteroidota bacterium]